MHADRDASDACGLNGTVVTKNDVNGGRKWGVVVEPIATSTHVARGTGIDDPAVFYALRTGVRLSLQDMFTRSGWALSRARSSRNSYGVEKAYDVRLRKVVRRRTRRTNSDLRRRVARGGVRGS